MTVSPEISSSPDAKASGQTSSTAVTLEQMRAADTELNALDPTTESMAKVLLNLRIPVVLGAIIGGMIIAYQGFVPLSQLESTPDQTKTVETSPGTRADHPNSESSTPLLVPGLSHESSDTESPPVAKQSVQANAETNRVESAEADVVASPVERTKANGNTVLDARFVSDSIGAIPPQHASGMAAYLRPQNTQAFQAGQISLNHLSFSPRIPQPWLQESRVSQRTGTTDFPSNLLGRAMSPDDREEPNAASATGHAPPETKTAASEANRTAVTSRGLDKPEPSRADATVQRFLREGRKSSGTESPRTAHSQPQRSDTVLTLENTDSQAGIHFLLNRKVAYLGPGDAIQRRQGGPEWQIQFHRGGDLGNREIILKAGTYAFSATHGRGWRLRAAHRTPDPIH